jgi:two-component system sensor histidine kinase DctS
MKDHSLDFALLQQPLPRLAARNRRALLWLLGLLALLLGSVLLLVLYLNNFEAEEETRKRAADAQWLEQSVQFHFRRLEDDLLVLARQALLQVNASDPANSATEPTPGAGNVQGGLLWREPGVLLSQGWLVAGRVADLRVGPPRWQLDWAAHGDNASALAQMQTTTVGLRRAAYAGLMRQADGSFSDVIWLAVPFFDRGQFAGNYLAAISMDRAMTALLPGWFAQNNQVQLKRDDAIANAAALAQAGNYSVALNLPGTELLLHVSVIQNQPATVPRIFFMVALLFLLGMLLSLYVLRRDIDKRQQIQAHLQAEVALRTAMENSVTTGLRAWDLQGQILYVNQAFCRLVGFSATELVGCSFPLPYWPPDQADELRAIHRDIIAQGTQDDGVEVQFQHRDGRLIDVLIHEAPLHTANGTQIGWMSSVLDISERKRSQRLATVQQEKLEASGRLVVVGEVASTLAHELNQPLGALSSFAAGLLNRLRSNSIQLDELLPVVERMARLAERAGSIIARVNAFARQRELSRQQLDLTALLRRVQSAENLQPGVQWVLPAQPVWIEADELLLEHLINNLLSNALEWASRGTSLLAQVRVEMRLDNTQSMALIAVADTGPGVPEAAQESIFNAFFSTKEGGMGMGLAICRSIVEAHHGRIQVGRDVVLGGGSFTVYLPLSNAQSLAI